MKANSIKSTSNYSYSKTTHFKTESNWKFPETFSRPLCRKVLYTRSWMRSNFELAWIQKLILIFHYGNGSFKNDNFRWVIIHILCHLLMFLLPRVRLSTRIMNSSNSVWTFFCSNGARGLSAIFDNRQTSYRIMSYAQTKIIKFCKKCIHKTKPRFRVN